MLFGKKKNQPSERVLNLKARVDALRQADEASRNKDKPITLDTFLEGDDVLTGRDVEDNYTPSGFNAQEWTGTNEQPSSYQGDAYGVEVNLEAELQKYLQRQEEQARQQAQDGDLKRRPLDLDPPGRSSSLNGTWSRDEAPPQSTSPEAAWDAAAVWATPPSPSPEPEAPRATWPNMSEWPAEEQWPPRDEEAV